MIKKDDIWAVINMPRSTVRILGVRDDAVIYIYTGGFYSGTQECVLRESFTSYFKFVSSAKTEPGSLVERELEVLKSDPVRRQRDAIFRRMFGCN